MSRTEHTYLAGDVKIALIVPEGIEVPLTLKLKRSSDGAVGTFKHSGSKAVRSPQKRAPRKDPESLIEVGWQPPVEEVERLKKQCPSVNFEHELEQMIDYYRGHGQKMKDWAAVWRRWMRTTHKRNLEKGWKPPKARPADSRAQWFKDHGITEAEWEARKGDENWVAMIRRRGRVS